MSRVRRRRAQPLPRAHHRAHLLPLNLDGIGFSPTMLVLTLVLVAVLISAILLAPETKNASLG